MRKRNENFLREKVLDKVRLEFMFGLFLFLTTFFLDSSLRLSVQGHDREKKANETIVPKFMINTEHTKKESFFFEIKKKAMNNKKTFIIKGEWKYRNCMWELV